MTKPNFTTDQLPYNSLRCNERVQRATIPARWKKLSKNWNATYVAAITVSIRDRTAWIIDGQHRWLAAMDRGLGDMKVLCHVYRGLTEQQEAALFLALNDSRVVNPHDKYYVGLIADDPVCCGIRDTLAKYYLKVGKNTGDIRCVAEVMSIYQKSPEALDDLCSTLTCAWGTRATALEKVIVAGLGIVLARYNGELDHSVLVTKLAKYKGGPGALCGNARGLMDYRPITLRRAAAEIIVDTYNHGRGAGRLSPL